MFAVLLYGGDAITHGDGGKKSISLSVHTRKVSLGTFKGCLLFFARVAVWLSRWCLIENLLLAFSGLYYIWGIAVEMVAKRFGILPAAATECRRVNVLFLLWNPCKEKPNSASPYPTPTHPTQHLNHGWIDAKIIFCMSRGLQHNL